MDTQSVDTQSKHPVNEAPKEAWVEPILRKTPIAETAGTKTTAVGDGLDAFSS
ncbi:MAG: hypothetical protein WBO46_04165 [Caldilineaceae bacterium]